MATYQGYGGGSGGRISLIMRVTPGQQFPVTVGGGGAAGIDWNVANFTETQRGKTGGASSFGAYTANGGVGGYSTTAGTGGDTSGDVASSSVVTIGTSGVAANGLTGGGSGHGRGGNGTSVFGGNGATTAGAGRNGIVLVWW